MESARRQPHDRAHAHRPGAHHDHGVAPGADARLLAVAMGLLVAFMAFEVAAAFVSHSLALLSDAGHMLTDVGALGGSLVAIRLAARPPTGALTYGFQRAEILAAAANAITLLLVSVLVLLEAARRLGHPPPVEGPVMVVVAAVGVVVNVAATAVLGRANRSSLNIAGAYQHVLTDLYAFAGTVVAGVVVWTTGFRRADAVASLLVVALMVRSAVGLMRPALRILVEATPEDVDVAEVRRHMMQVPEVVAVHDLHAWTLTSDLPVLTAHVVISEACMGSSDAARVLDELQACLAGHFDVRHSTFQLEPAGHADHEAPGHP